ncbi:hypothetical protein KY306_03535, partial [Candidatus Woesearchaeota archaeon]|nr:hypothetical protein [Candidatus Woesearchaeota archaeon]
MPEEPKEVRVYLVGEKKGVLITDEQNIILTAGGLRLGDPNKKYEDKFVDDFFQPGRDVQIFPIDPDWTHANAATVVKEAYTLPPETYQKIRET